MGIKRRIVCALCGFIPILNLIVLTKLVDITKDEVEFELKKERIAADPALAELCKTKYPILLVHEVFFRDSKWFSYWGRILRTLRAHGAKMILPGGIYAQSVGSVMPYPRNGQSLLISHTNT